MSDPISTREDKPRTAETPAAIPAPAPSAPAKSAADAADVPPTTPAAPPAPDKAVQRCCSAYHHALATTRDKDKAKEAFKNALPFLTNRATILDFMACITQGMVLSVFWFDEGPKLIHAARATLAALPREPAPIPEHAAKAAGRPSKNQQRTLPEN